MTFVNMKLNAKSEYRNNVKPEYTANPVFTVKMMPVNLFKIRQVITHPPFLYTV